jgi:hypothetical protein
MISALAYTIPLAFASGLNVYATVAVLGLCSHFGLVALPEQFRAFDHPAIISIALAMYIVEFVADKIPWFDSFWDVAHTIVRPIGGAFVAVTALGTASPTTQVLAALLGGSVAMSTHLTKAGTRAAANTSPEPFTNWLLSLGEDVLAVALTYVATQHPLIATFVALALLVVMLLFASVLVRAVRRRFRRSRQPALATQSRPR